MNSVSSVSSQSQKELVKADKVLLVKDRAFYIVYLTTLFFPLLVGFIFYYLVLQARFDLGYWPKYGEGGWGGFPGILGIFNLLIFLPAFGISPSIYCIPTSIIMTVLYARKSPIFSVKKLLFFISVIIINIVAIWGISSNFAGLWEWYID